MTEETEEFRAEPYKRRPDGYFLFEILAERLSPGSFELLLKVDEEEQFQLPEEIWILEGEDYQALIDEIADEQFLPSPGLTEGETAAEYVKSLIYARLREDGFGEDDRGRFEFRMDPASFRMHSPGDVMPYEGFSSNPIHWTTNKLLDQFRELALYGAEYVSWDLYHSPEFYALRCHGKLLEPLSERASAYLEALANSQRAMLLRSGDIQDPVFLQAIGGPDSRLFDLEVSHRIDNFAVEREPEEDPAHKRAERPYKRDGAVNKAAVYKGPGEVAVEEIEYPKLEVPEEVASAMGMSKEAPHGVILEVVSSGICSSDQHMVRGQTTTPIGQTLGHEVTGMVVEKGNDVQFIDVGDICSVPFNIACGRCRNCNEGKTDICLNVNPARAGATYGYADMGGWTGGQANYVMVPFADFNLLKFPDRDQALEKVVDLALLSDILPTGYHSVYTAGVTTGSTVYVAGAGSVGLAAAHSAQLLGAAVVIVGDLSEEKLAQARSFGCETINVGEEAPIEEQIADIVGEPEVDSAVDAVGFEASARPGEEASALVLNQIQTTTRSGGRLGIPGLYATGDPGAADPDAREETLKIRFGLGWAKSHAFLTGQCPVKKYNRGLMMSILHDKAHIADAVNAKVITLEEAPQAYKDFDNGAARKYVIDPNGYINA